MPDPLDLDAIEARANAATEGPWLHDPTKCWAPGRGTPPAEPIYQPKEAVFARDLRAAICLTGNTDDPSSMADATFIAHARADVPALVARVRELEAQAAELRATLANERGEGEGPSKGWTFDGDNWHCADGSGMTVERWVDAEDGFCWRAVRDETRGQLIAGILRVTAREAMRAADKARGAS